VSRGDQQQRHWTKSAKEVGRARMQSAGVGRATKKGQLVMGFKNRQRRISIMRFSKFKALRFATFNSKRRRIPTRILPERRGNGNRGAALIRRGLRRSEKKENELPCPVNLCDKRKGLETRVKESKMDISTREKLALWRGVRAQGWGKTRKERYVSTPKSPSC